MAPTLPDPLLPKPVVAVCASLHPASRAQMHALAEAGIDVVVSSDDRRDDPEVVAAEVAERAHSEVVAVGARSVILVGGDTHTVKAFLEAEAYNGPALIIAYSNCIAHGYDMVFGMNQQKAAVLSGYWPLMRFNPSLVREGKNPFQLDSKPPSVPLKDYAYGEARYTILARSNPTVAAQLLREAQEDVHNRWRDYESQANMPGSGSGDVKQFQDRSQKSEAVAERKTEGSSQ
jgi:hypothetical protein